MKKSLFGLLTLAAIVPLAACNGPTPTGETIDDTKTQIFVYNFDGGYGSEWLEKTKKRFEELHKDDVWETGKKGVQVCIKPKKESIMAAAPNILANKEEIYFSEYAVYRTLLADGILGEITDAVTADLADYGEPGKSIESKLSTEQQNFWGIDDGGSKKYYGIPHYSGYTGLTYNVDLFESKGYYFLDEPVGSEIEDKFIIPGKGEKRSAGPDGLYDTYDDGLPATYDEFWTLCRYMVQNGTTPFISNGTNVKDYTNHLVESLACDYEGYEQYGLYWQLDGGQAKTLSKIVAGELVKDATPTTITGSNGYECARQAGKYYAVKWLETIFNNATWRNSKMTNPSFSHVNAQDAFLKTGTTNEEYGIMSEGIWWENESKETFTKLADMYGESYSRDKRKFAFMPLPHATQEKYEEVKKLGAGTEHHTLFDHIHSICFMKANVADWKRPLLIDFLKFCRTDETLIEYTVTTNTPMAYNYTVPESEKAKMSYFGRSIIELKEDSKVVYPSSSNEKFVNNQGEMANHFHSLNAGVFVTFPAEGLQAGQTAEDYFTHMYDAAKQIWANFN